MVPIIRTLPLVVLIPRPYPKLHRCTWNAKTCTLWISGNGEKTTDGVMRMWRLAGSIVEKVQRE